jgi:hypothetical protein
MIAYLITEIDGTEVTVLGVRRYLGDALDQVAATDAKSQDNLEDQGRVEARMLSLLEAELGYEPPSLDTSVRVSSLSASVDYQVEAIELDEREFGLS